ncbi:MerR family transcriptional regulator [Alphaproteobacteria bacterium]|nr:MerR family transcriptional regulator [Alphaproteobacteria bacterium]
MIETSSYHTISNVSKKLKIAPHVLRFWEKKFSFIKPKKSQTGRRYYSNQDIVNLEIIKDLLHNKGYTITGAIKFIKSNNEIEENKNVHLNINNDLLVKKIEETHVLISSAKNILGKY